LGVVKHGEINLKNTDLEIRSIYGPKLEHPLTLNISESKLQLGSIQGNIKISSSNECQVIIENMECLSFEFTSTNDEHSYLEIFINSIQSPLKIKGEKIKTLIILNSENIASASIIHNGNKISTNAENEENIIDIQSQTNPSIMKMTSWEFMKRKIENKIKNKII
jgi:hypothetical protein